MENTTTLSPNYQKIRNSSFYNEKIIFFLFFIAALLFSTALRAQDLSTGSLLGRTSHQFFEPNLGQIADADGNLQPQIKYIYRAPGMVMGLTQTGFVYSLYMAGANPGSMGGPVSATLNPEASSQQTYNFHRVEVEFLHSDPNIEIIGAEETGHYSNYYLSHCPQGVTGVVGYGQVTYKNLYPNIDLVVSHQKSNQGQAQLKYDIIVHPGGDLSQVKMAYKGMDGMQLSDGTLEVATSAGNLSETIPASYWAETDETVNVSYQLKNDVVSFVASEQKQGQTLVVDPMLVWSTYIGGSEADQSNDIATSGSGAVYITGYSASSNFPITSGAYQTSNNGILGKAVLSKFSRNGSLIWSTYIGGNFWDIGESVVTDGNGNIFIVGQTVSTSFPTTSGAYQASNGGNYDAFLSKFTSSGSLDWSTYLGGSSSDRAFGVATDASGNVYVTGETGSSNFPTSSAYQNTNGGNTDAFLSKFTGSGSLSWSTYIGGSNPESSYGIEVDLNGDVYITGSTNSSNYPVTSGAFQSSNGGNEDAFLSKFSSSGSLSWSTYAGGGSDDIGYAVASDSSGSVFITGETGSSDFPVTSGVYQATITGNVDAFVAKFDDSGAPLWGSFIGGASDDIAYGIAIDSVGKILITGSTKSSDFPASSGAYQNIYGGNEDAFICKFSLAGTTLGFSTYLGGSGTDVSKGVALNDSGYAYITGYTGSSNFPVSSGAYQGSNSGSDDAFLCKINFRAPEIMVKGAGNMILNGQTAVSTTNLTDFGSPLSGTAISVQYSILNTGNDTLFISGVSKSGSSAFTVDNLSDSTLQVGGSAGLVIRYEPTTPGPHTAVIEIDNNDADEATFTFAVKGDIFIPSATRIYVDSAATGSSNGYTWADAYNNLQDALATASAGDSLWIANGTYFPDQGSGITAGDRDTSFVIPQGVKLFGGFDGSESSFDQRDPEINITRLSGEIGGGTSADNTKSIVKVNDEGVVLDGLIIEKGAGYDGAGLLADGSAQCAKVLINNCIFRYNRVSNNGAAIWANGSYGACAEVEIHNSTFEHNISEGNGGAIFMDGEEYGYLYIGNCVFNSNVATLSGGAIALFNCKTTTHQIRNSLFLGNIATVGGAIHAYEENNLVIIGSVFAGNLGLNSSGNQTAGGAILIGEGTLNIYNSTFAYNEATAGGAILNSAAVVNFYNSIFWNDTSTGSGYNNEYVAFNATMTPDAHAYNTIIKGGAPVDVIGSIYNYDPLFTNSSVYNLSLSATSPARDAGYNFFIQKDYPGYIQDINGNDRYQNRTIDIGAYEYDTTITSPYTITQPALPQEYGPEFVNKLPWQNFKLQDRFNYYSRQDNEHFGLASYADDEISIFGMPDYDLNGSTVKDAGLAYIYIEEIDNHEQLIPPYPNSGAKFGSSVARSDYVVAVGAPYDGVNASGALVYVDAGAVYLYEFSGGYPYDQQITSLDRTNSDGFGYAIALNNDYLFVGAPFEDEDNNNSNTLSNSGSVYIFERSGGSWSQVQKITAPSRAAGDLFGASLALDQGVLVVGAPGANSGDGEAFVFTLSGGSYSNVQAISPADLNAADSFALSLALNNEVLIAGAPYQDNAVSNLGAAYQYTWEGSAFAYSNKFLPAEAIPDAKFGTSVSIADNFIAVGMPVYETNSNDSFLNAGLGRVNLYMDTSYNHRDFRFKSTLRSNHESKNEGFGQTLALTSKKLFVGAPYNNLPLGGVSNELERDAAGAVKVFRKLYMPLETACIQDITHLTDTSFKVWFTPGSGHRRMVVVTEDNAAPKAPVDSVDYPADSAFGNLATRIGGSSSKSYVVYDSTGISAQVNNLQTGKFYTIEVYEYFDGSNAESNRVYSRWAEAIEQKAEALDMEPDSGTKVQSFSTGGNQKILTVTRGHGDKYIIIGRGANFNLSMPIDGQTYNPNFTGVVTSGCMRAESDMDEDGSGFEVIYIGTEIKHVWNQCDYNGYRIRIIEFNDENGSPNYLTSSYSELLIPESGMASPPDMVRGFNFTDTSCSSIKIETDSAGNGDGFVLVVTKGHGNPAASHEAGVMEATSKSEITGLEEGQDYTVTIFEYNEGDCGNEDWAYEPGSSKNITTDSNCSPASEPMQHASAVSAIEIGAVEATIKFTPGDGENRMIVIREDLATQWQPVDQNTYEKGPVDFKEWIVYIGNEDTITITGLLPNTRYETTIFEFNGGTDRENYLTSGSPATYGFTTLDARIWKGFEDKYWNEDGNWLDEDVPSTTDHVLVDQGSNNPTVYDDVTVKSINIEEGASLTIFNGKTITISDNFENRGNKNLGEGTLKLSGSSQQKIRGSVEVKNLTVDNTNGVLFQSLSGRDTLKINGDLNLNSGHLDIGNGTLIIQGKISGTGIIKGSKDASIVIAGVDSTDAGTLVMSSTDSVIRSLKIDRGQSGTPGSITVESDVHIDSFLTLNNGHVIASNGNIHLGKDVVISGGSGNSYLRVSGNGSVFTTVADGGLDSIPVGFNPYLPVIIENTSGTEETFEIYITDGVNESPDGSGNSLTEDVVTKTWHIIPQGSSGSVNVNITLQWNNTDQFPDPGAGNSGNNVRIAFASSSNSDWDPGAFNDANVQEGIYTLTRSGISLARGIEYVFGISAGNDALPVELISFSAGLDESGSSVLLDWVTASEFNTSHFEIERSTDGQNWTKVGEEKAAGFTHQTHYYRHTDRLDAVPQTLYYRLRMVDLDGSFEFSPVRVVSIDKLAAAAITVYPNPSNGEFNLTIHAAQDDKAVLQLTSTTGATVWSGEMAVKAGMQVITLAPDMPSGIYLLHVKFRNVNRVLKVVKN